MTGGQPSTTADRAALLRAAHHLLDVPPILADALAIRLIDPAARAAFEADPSALQTPLLRALRCAVAIRSRWAEDRLGEALARGVRQYVILGAGLDSFAYRNPFPPSVLHVYEVDHPSTQARKRERLRAAGIAMPAALTFVPIDFERESIEAALAAHGFAAKTPAFVSWLGVTVYLRRDAVMRTLAWAASLAAGSEIVFSYDAPRPGRGSAAWSALAARAAAVGEPWITVFEPDALARDVRGLGFAEVVDFGPDEAWARYCRDRPDGLRPGGSAHLMSARTGGQGGTVRP
jgi:methyltransferase (TIGR00027 family)